MPLDPGFVRLDTASSSRLGWGQFGAIRNFFQQSRTEANGYYGFFPADVLELTRLSSHSIRQFVSVQGKVPDVVLFAPLCDRLALFASTVEEGEFFHPGLARCAEEVLAPLLGRRAIHQIVMDSRQAVLRNCFVAKPKFWRRWIQANELVFSIADGPPCVQKDLLNQPMDSSGMPMKHAIADRTASLLLAVQGDWKVAAYDSFRLPFSDDPPFAKLGVVDAVALDALKLAYRERSMPEYLATFIAARRRFFTGRQPPFGADMLLSSAAPAELAPGPATIASAPPAAGQGLPATDAVVAGNPGSLTLIELLTAAERLTTAGKQDDAIRLYQDWLAGSASPQAYVARFNLGHMLAGRGDLQQALETYQQALQQNPRFPQARLNLGSVLERLGRKDDAIAEWQRVSAELAADPSADIAYQIHALNSMGRLLEDMGRFAEAESALGRSLTVKPDQEDALHHWVHLRQKQCKWPVYQSFAGIPVEKMMQATSALATLSASNDPAWQLQIARKFTDSKVRHDLPRLAPEHAYGHDRLRVAYLSSNFGMHAVSILTAELYELHDRSRFEIYGFCWSPEDNSPMRMRVRQAMDHFIRIDKMSDEEAAQAIRAAEIDILVDLQGLTSGCRANIIAHRPAPLQVTYLGFPGTTALPGIDYVLADSYVIPDESARYFTEKPLYLPDCFQINDRKRTAGALPARAKYGLGEDALVFCAFNHNHKFTPELFAVWMNILRRTPGSVLWLLADNEQARRNLLDRATEAGIEEQRLIFAPRVPAAEYLARFQLADLFLDTFPFNGGTTASDALWMGLPVITCSGATFASRMAGSLLHAIGVPELATSSFSDYEELAVNLATDRVRLSALRARVEANRKTHPLFDTPRFVRALENLYEQVAAKL